MSLEFVARIRNCHNLPSIPAIALRVLELCQHSNLDLSEIARVVSQDPALCAKILRTVNSALYANAHAVSSLDQALVILGLRSVKTLILSFSLVGNLANRPTKGFKHTDYWKRSINTASAAKIIASRINLAHAEEAFLAALLADIGMLVLDNLEQKRYNEICSQAREHNQLIELERAAFGITHPEVGAALTVQWKLPPILSTPIAFSHNPAGAAGTEIRKVAEVIELAGLCADVFINEPAAGAINLVRQTCASRYGMSESACDEMMASISKETKQLASLLEINIGPQLHYEDILAKASEELVILNLLTQQEAADLQQQNQQLKQQLRTDRLTGLANRTSLEQFLADQFEILDEDRPLSLLIVDVDQFKTINDTHGHLAGDAALQAIAGMLQAHAREQDHAARYGGDEMVMVLPCTTSQEAVEIADQLRKDIAAARCDALPSQVTVSIGLATATPRGPVGSPSQLIKAADLAVYAAKAAGRNSVRIFSAPTSAAA
jgi:two-component system, cell cycle response regulator